MAFDSYDYDIKKRMPEWWKEDTILEPINRYSQKLIRDLVGGLLENFGLIQPVQVWKTLPTEYSWLHSYTDLDERLRNPEGGAAHTTLEVGVPLRAYIPNSKRNCHGIIKLKLEGTENNMSERVAELKIKNGNQQITIKNIRTSTDIEIRTEDGIILIDGVSQPHLTHGFFNKIYSQAESLDYDELDVYDENKITFVEIESSTKTNFSLQIKLIHPVYVTEQNIRLHTVSAFPLEWVKLYGFFCHDFNNKQEWRFLWEKEYNEYDRVVFDRITKQFDCETFYVQVKLYGIGMPFVYGFPQEEFATNPAFQTNANLDKWGRVYGMPRRFYKTKISEDEEPYTYPAFYNYDIEQDYWYEQRLANEYRYSYEAINSSFIKDSNFSNIAILECIDPFMHDLYVYTETIPKTIDFNNQTEELIPEMLSESGEGVTWQNPKEIENLHTTAAEVVLQPQTNETFNTKENRTKLLEIFFNIPPLPKNINIKGIELLLNGHTDLHSDKLILDDRCKLLLPTMLNDEVTDIIDKIPINNEPQYWEKGKGTYRIGAPNYLFNQKEIKREQIQNGIGFEIGLTNLNEFLKATIVLYSIGLIIYYETIEGSYTMNVDMSDTEIVLSDTEKQNVSMYIKFENTGEIPITNKNVYIAVPKELSITNNSFPTFDLEVGERGDNKFIIGKTNNDKIIITSSNNKTGIYDVVILCDDRYIKKEIIVREGYDDIIE